jgi:hypothetical protein
MKLLKYIPAFASHAHISVYLANLHWIIAQYVQIFESILHFVAVQTVIMTISKLNVNYARQTVGIVIHKIVCPNNRLGPTEYGTCVCSTGALDLLPSTTYCQDCSLAVPLISFYA